MDTAIDLLQWPAMAVTVGASWLVASSNEKRRNWGALDLPAQQRVVVGVGWATQTWALVMLQVALAAKNRKFKRTFSSQCPPGDAPEHPLMRSLRSAAAC